MSGRPSAPSWATETNFPAGGQPWNGQPAKVQPPGDLWTPNLKEAAEYRNWLDNAICTALQSLTDWAGNSPAMNWSPEGLINGNGQNAVVWDATNGTWLASVYDDGTNKTYVYAGLAQDAFAIFSAFPWAGNMPGWTQLGNAMPVANAVTGLAGDPTGGWFAFLSNGAGNLQYNYLNTSTGTWISTRVLTTHYFAPEAIVFNGKVIVATAADSSALTLISYTTNHGSSWTDTAASGVLACNTRWLLKANGPGTQAIAIPSVQNASHYFTTSDGATWTQQSTLPVGLHDQPVGLTWGQDATGPCWFLAVNTTLTSSPSKCAFYRSSDGVTWTAITTVPSVPATLNVTDLAAIGNMLVAPVADGPNFVDDFIFSVDGGATWRAAPVVLGPNQAHTSAFYTKGRINTNGAQFMAWNSAFMRWSKNAGLPSSATL